MASTKHPGILSRIQINAKGFVFDPVTGRIFTVNATARFILDLIKLDQSPKAIVRSLSDRFSISTQEAQSDLDDFFYQLKLFGLTDPVRMDLPDSQV